MLSRLAVLACACVAANGLRCSRQDVLRGAAGLSIGGGYDGPGRSPDRADACIWALTALMLDRQGEARVAVM